MKHMERFEDKVTMTGLRVGRKDWRVHKYACSQYLERFDFFSRPFAGFARRSVGWCQFEFMVGHNLFW